MKREERREKEGMRRELLCSVEWAEGFYSVIKKFGNYLLIMGLVSVGTFLNIQVFWLCTWWADKELLDPGTDEFYLLLALPVLLREWISLLLSTEVGPILSMASACINFLVLWLGLGLVVWLKDSRCLPCWESMEYGSRDIPAPVGNRAKLTSVGILDKTLPKWSYMLCWTKWSLWVIATKETNTTWR